MPIQRGQSSNNNDSEMSAARFRFKVGLTEFRVGTVSERLSYDIKR